MFSVIIPTFNRPELTLKAVQSVLDQTYKDFELIVVDDGSTFDYSKIQRLLMNNGQSYIKTKNLGVSHARNVGLKNSTRPIISFLDSDDYWNSNKLESHKSFFENNSELKIVQNYERWFRFGKEVQVPQHLKPNSGDEFLRSLKMCCIGSSSVSIIREVFEKVGFFNEKLRLCEDYDFWLRASFSYKIGLVEEVLTVKVSGSHPQLTSSEGAFDRFRLYSLVIFFYEHLEALLKQDDKLKNTVEIIIFKAQILLNGAKSRDLENDVTNYQLILDYFNKTTDFVEKNRDLVKLVLKLEETLNFRPKLKKSSSL